jgi:hypothetical protein
MILYSIQWQASYHGNWSCHANKPASIQGRREGGGGQNTRGPECSVGPGNLGNIFVLFIITLCLSQMKYAYFVKRTRCEIDDFSIVFSAKTVSWTSFTLRFYQVCGDFLQIIHWQFSRWLRLKIASRRVKRDRGPGFTNHHFGPGPVVGSRRPCIYLNNANH